MRTERVRWRNWGRGAQRCGRSRNLVSMPSDRLLAGPMQLEWGAHAPSRAAEGALAVRNARVDSTPFGSQARAKAEARAPRPTREGACSPRRCN